VLAGSWEEGGDAHRSDRRSRFLSPANGGLSLCASRVHSRVCLPCRSVGSRGPFEPIGWWSRSRCGLVAFVARSARITRHRENRQRHDSVWRHLDLGRWRLEVHARLRRLVARARRAGGTVPFARDGARFTADFDNLVAWLATDDKTATCRLTRSTGTRRADHQTCRRRALGELDRLSDLFEISIDEVRGARPSYLTLIGDHPPLHRVGLRGKGRPPPSVLRRARPAPPPQNRARQAAAPSARAPIMVPFGPCRPSRRPRHPRRVARSGSEIEPAIFARASRLTAVSMT